MATIKVEFKNIDRLLYRFNRIANMDLTEKVNKATTLVHGQAKSLAPVNKGNLAESIHMEVKKNEDKIMGRVYTNTEYAPYVEFGTGIKGNGTYPYKIKGVSLAYRNTKWCYTPDGGKTFIWTKGQVAQPFMYPAIKNSKKAIKLILSTGVKENLKNCCRGGQ